MTSLLAKPYRSIWRRTYYIYVKVPFPQVHSKTAWSFVTVKNVITLSLSHTWNPTDSFSAASFLKRWYFKNESFNIIVKMYYFYDFMQCTSFGLLYNIYYSFFTCHAHARACFLLTWRTVNDGDWGWWWFVSIKCTLIICTYLP